jgi:predicted phosphohydrolase
LRKSRLPYDENTQAPVRIVCISDTHTLLPSALPDGDILIHAGDFSNDGTIAELQAHIDWLDSLPYRYKIAIAGNHDTYLDPTTRLSLPESSRNGSLDWKSIRYLQHNAITLNFPVQGYNTRKLTFYGAPQIPACGSYETHAFQYERGTEDLWIDTVPNDVDVLITHTPPKYHLDVPLPSGLGCEFLLKELWRVKPLLHVFGHVHWGAGMEVCEWSAMQKVYEDGMACEDGFAGGCVNIGLWTCVAKVFVLGFVNVVRSWVMNVRTEETQLVNAAQMVGHTGRLSGEVIVVTV